MGENEMKFQIFKFLCKHSNFKNQMYKVSASILYNTNIKLHAVNKWNNVAYLFNNFYIYYASFYENYILFYIYSINSAQHSLDIPKFISFREKAMNFL